MMICEKCNSNMVVKTNKANGQQFWACEGYPACKNTKPLEPDKVPVEKPFEQPKVAQKPMNGQKAMYVSYAKDIFCALLPNATEQGLMEKSLVMNSAIQLVKQAQEAFE